MSIGVSEFDVHLKVSAFFNTKISALRTQIKQVSNVELAGAKNVRKETILVLAPSLQQIFSNLSMSREACDYFVQFRF